MKRIPVSVSLFTKTDHLKTLRVNLLFLHLLRDRTLTLEVFTFESLLNRNDGVKGTNIVT